MIFKKNLFDLSKNSPNKKDWLETRETLNLYVYRMNSIVTKLAILSIEDGLCLNCKIYGELS